MKTGLQLTHCIVKIVSASYSSVRALSTCKTESKEISTRLPYLSGISGVSGVIRCIDLSTLYNIFGFVDFDMKKRLVDIISL